MCVYANMSLFERTVDIVQSLPPSGPIQTSFEEKLALYGYVASTNETADCTSRVRSAWTNMISHRGRYYVPPSGDV